MGQAPGLSEDRVTEDRPRAAPDTVLHLRAAPDTVLRLRVDPATADRRSVPPLWEAPDMEPLATELLATELLDTEARGTERLRPHRLTRRLPIRHRLQAPAPGNQIERSSWSAESRHSKRPGSRSRLPSRAAHRPLRRVGTAGTSLIAPRNTGDSR